MADNPLDQNPQEDPKPKPKSKAQDYLEASNLFNSKVAAGSLSQNQEVFRDYKSPGEATTKFKDEAFGYNPLRDNEDFYAKQQSWYSEVPKAVGKLPLYTLAKVGQGVGFTLGLINPVNWFSEDNLISSASDNAFSHAFESFEETVKNEWGPTFQEAADRNKGFFSRAATDLNFWTEDVVDGAAFMASAFIPGMVLSKLGTGAKLVKALSGLKLGATAANGIVDGASMAQNYLANAQKIAKGFDTFTTWATATASESMFEAKEVRDNVLKSLDGAINEKTGLPYTEKEKKAIAGGAAQNTFLMNSALLGFTNVLQMNYLFKALGRTEAAATGITQKALGESFEKALPTTMVGKFLASNTGQALKGAGLGIASEGYVEENTQLAIQRMNQEYGALGKVAGLSDYLEPITRAVKQAGAAFMGEDKEASMSIGLGGLLGGGMSAVGDVREAKRERLTTASAVNYLNKTQENWMKFGDIYQHEDEVTTNDQGEEVTVKKTKLDKDNNPVVDEAKMAAAISGLQHNTDLSNVAEIVKDKNQSQFITDIAFRDFVQAHVEAGIGSTLIEKLDKVKTAKPEELVKMGFDPSTSPENISAKVEDMKSLAAAFIQQNELIKSSVLTTGNADVERARKNTLVSLATEQTILNKTVKNVNDQSSKIKTGLISFDAAALSDGAVDHANAIQYRILSQKKVLDSLKSSGIKSNFQIKAAESLLQELEKEHASYVKENKEAFDKLGASETGLYTYEKAERQEHPLNVPYQRKMMEKAAYQNAARHKGLQFALLADTKNGLKNFTDHINDDIVTPFNQALENQEAAEAEGSDGPKLSTVIATQDEAGENIELTITEGEEYITKASEENKIFKGQVVKTYNNNLIKVIKIDGDNITIKVNNDKVYTITKDRFADAGKLWPLKDMSAEEKIYFKNRDQVFNLNVRATSGKLHLNKGKALKANYSKAGIAIKARLVLVKEDGKNVLKVQYINPVTKKKETVDYEASYVKKYGDNKFNLRSLPGEEEAILKQAEERKARNLVNQLQIFNERVDEASDKLKQAEVDKQTNDQKFEDLRQQLMNDRAHLELVTEELAKSDGKRGRKSKAFTELTKTRTALIQSITVAQEQIDALKLERTSLETLLSDLKSAKNLYEDTVLDLEITQSPFDRDGGENLSSNTEQELADLEASQVTTRFSAEQIDGMLLDTQAEIDELTSKINSLTGYVKDLKSVLADIDVAIDYENFMDLPENVTKRSALREYLRKKITAETDPAQKEKYQALMTRVLKGGKEAENILFILSSLRDSVKDITKAEAELTTLIPKRDRLALAGEEKILLTTLAERIEYLKQVQQILTEDLGKVRAVKTEAAKSSKIEGQDDFASDTDIESDTDAPTFKGPKKPKFEEVGFNKTVGRHYLDENDEQVNTVNGSERFFAFTATQNVQGQDIHLEVVTESNDTFGILQSEYPGDVKAIVTKKVGDEYQYLDQNGEVIENPTKDNIVYMSLTNVNNVSVERVRNDYTVAESTTDAQIQEKIDEYVAYQKDLVEKTKTEPVYLNATSASPGIQRVERLSSIDESGKRPIAKAEAEGRLVEDNPDWGSLKSANSKANIELRVSTANGAIAGGVLPGRAVLQEFTYDGSGKKIWGDKVTRVFNRELDATEKDNVIQSLVRLTDLFGKKNKKAVNGLAALSNLGKEEASEEVTALTETEQAEYNLIMGYLKNILCWGIPKNGVGNSDRFFYIQNGLNRGSVKIPFTEQSILANRDKLLENVYHHVNNRSLQKNEEVDTIKFVDGKAVPDKSYSTYTEYLLAKREDGVPPVYTSMPRADAGVAQRTNSYINWVDPTVEPAKPIEVKKPEVAPAISTIDQDIDEFINYKKKSITVKDVIITYGKSGDGVAIQFKKGDKIKTLPAFDSVDQILNNKEKIKQQIYEAASYRPGLGALSQLANVKTTTPAAPVNQPVNATPAVEKILTQNSVPAVAVPAKEDETKVTASGDTIYFTIEEAVKNAKPKTGKLSATVHEENVVTKETRVAMTATVNIPDGKLEAAKVLLQKALISQINNDDDAAPFRLALSEVTALEDFKALEEFMTKNLPQVPVHKVGHLIHGKAWGAFMNGAMYIYDKAERGTGFHEAFETVWGSYISDAEQAELIKEFRSRKGEFTNPFSKETKAYKDATVYDAREMMAEEFRSYVLDGNLSKKSKISAFFKDLWNFIQNILGLSKKERKNLDKKINNVFKKIGRGGYKNISPVRELSKQLPVYRSVGTLSQEQTAAAVEGLSYYFFLDLFKSGQSVDSLLNNLDKRESNKLLTELYIKAHDQVLQNAMIIGPGITSELNGVKKELYTEFKKTIQRYGLDVEEDVIDKEETTTNALGIRDSISINPTKMSSTNVKLLLSSLPAHVYNKKGNLVLTRNSLNQPKLADYEKTHVLLLNELSNVVSYFDETGTRRPALDLMFEKLDDQYQTRAGYYREGYAWIKNLKLRLKYEDINGVKVPLDALTADDISLRVSFIKSFTNVKTTPEKTIVGEEGYIYNLNPVTNVNTDRVKEQWSNELKTAINSGATSLVKLDPSGIIVINRDSADYKTLIDTLDKRNALDLNTAVDTLNMLGIKFSANKVQLKKYEKTIRENLIQILEQIKSGAINSISDLYGTNIVGGRISMLLQIEAGFTGEENILSYLNSDGQSQYSVGIPSLFSNILNILNSVSSLKELINTCPWLGNLNEAGEPVLFGYQVNSELLRKGGLLFNSKGERREGAKINYHVISGMGTSDFDGTSTDDLQFPERVANKIHYLLNNIVYSNINSDKSTEFGIGIPGKPMVSIGAIQKLLFFGSSPVVDLYMNQLTDEMYAALANKKSPSNIQHYKDQVESLGHFRDILGPELVTKFKTQVLGPKAVYTSDRAHEEFIKANKAVLEKTITSYLKSKTDQTVEFLKDLDIFTKPDVLGNDLYITDAIDNEALVEILKIQGSQKVTTGIVDNEKVERQGFTETDLKTLAAYLAFNEEALITEQHKLIYGHPAFYKDLAKRANGATSTKEQMVEDPEIINWMDDNMNRNDGKVRSNESQQTIKLISFADSEVLSPYHKEIAEEMYKSMISSENHETVEKKIGAKFDVTGEMTGYILNKKQDYTGHIKGYIKLNEADAMAWGLPDAVRDILFLTGKLSKEQQAQWDYEIAYEKIALSKLKNAPKYSKEELKAAEEIFEKGNPGYIFQVLKPQYFGYAENAEMLHPVFLKHAVQPKFYRHVEGTQYENLYMAAKKNQVDIIGFESGEKVGNVTGPDGSFTPVYNAKGGVNTVSSKKGQELPETLAQQKLYSKFYGIQVEMSAKAKETVIRGTQVSKLIMVNFYENGEPINAEVGAIIAEYNSTLIEMMKLGKKDLLKELGLVVEGDGYKTHDLVELTKTLRKQAESRDLPDNLIEAIDALLLPDGTYELKYKFDTLINREKIDNILNSIVDSRVISEKLHGKSSPQVASTLYESAPRDFMYIKDGVYTQLKKKDIAKLTAEEKASIKMQSTDLKFYRNEKGKIQSMEVYISWPYKNITPESMGLKLVNGVYLIPPGSKIDTRLLESLAFRIPTQAMNSIESIRIKGFTPANNGDMIVVPSEIVGKSGSDFDIDKLNIYLGNYFMNNSTGQIEYIDWKGSAANTKSYYEALYDKGELLSKEDLKELDRYIAEEQDALYDEEGNSALATLGKPLENNIKAKMVEMFSAEVLTKEFMNDLGNDQIRKAKIVDALVKKALQNHYVSTMKKLVQHPSNYRQLVVPNGVDTIKSLADEINEYKFAAGTKSREDEKSFNYLRTFIGSNQIRERYLTAKRMVGIAALHSTFHSMAQVSGLKISGTFRTKEIKYLASPKEENRRIAIKLAHNEKLEDGKYNIGARLDKSGAWISEMISEELSGFVDGAKDPFVFDLNFSMNTASTWFYLQHLGVPVDEIGYFYGQPILDEYFTQQAKNSSGFKKVNNNNLSREELFYNITAPYFKQITGRDINQELSNATRFSARAARKLKQSYITELNEINNAYETFSKADLIAAIKAGKKVDAKLQLAVLMNYLEYAAQASSLGKFIQAIGYDNSKTKTIQENMLQVAKWEKSKEEGFIANPDNVLEKTFIGEMKMQKEDIFKMFKDFFITLSPEVQKAFKPLEDKINNPDFFSSKTDQAVLLQRYQNFVVTYLLHTTEHTEDGVTSSLNSLYEGFFTGKDSIAKTLQKFKNSPDPTISENLVIKELLPMMTEDVNKTDNISLFRNKIDTFQINNLIEAIDNLKTYALQTADNELLTLVNNLAKFSILQSGLQSSSIDFKKILSTDIYSELLKNILDNFTDGGKTIDVQNLWRSFHQNQWNNKAVVGKAPTWLKLKDNRAYISETSSLAVNDYIVKYAKKPGMTRDMINQLRKEKRMFEAFQPLLLEKKYLNSDGKWVYEPINKLGDGYRMTEIYLDERASIIKSNGDVKTDFDAVSSSSDNTGWVSYKSLMGNGETTLSPGPIDQSAAMDALKSLGAPELKDQDPIQTLKDKGIIQRDC